MRQSNILTLTALAVTAALAGCGSQPTSGLTTSSLSAPQTAAAAPAVDPACTSLSQQIAATRAEGTPARVHAVATGKTKTVSVKRESLAKVAELDRLNSEFQVKCSKVPVQQSAAVTSQPNASATIAKARASAKVAKIAATTPQAGTTPIVAVPR